MHGRVVFCRCTVLSGEVFPPTLARKVCVTFEYGIIGRVVSYVPLNEGDAKVVRRIGDQYASPIVQIIQEDVGNSITPEDCDIFLNLADSDLDVPQVLPTPGRIEIRTGHEIIDQKYGLNGIVQRRR